RLGWFVAGAFVVVMTLLTFHGAPKTPVGSILNSLFNLLAVVWIIVAFSDRFRFGTRLPPCANRQDVFAHRGEKEKAIGRVVFVAHPNAPARRWPLATRSWLFFLLFAPAGLAAFLPRLGYRGQLVLVGSITAELVATLLLMREPFRGRPTFDHRPGL